LAGLAWLRAQAFVQPKRIAVAGNSFGGIEAILADNAGYCAVIDSAGGAESWARAPELQQMMIKAVQRSPVPIFFFQAQNDYNLSPTRILSSAMKAAGKPYKVKLYPPFGHSAAEGHVFGYFGSTIWADDVFQFLDEYCAGD
jgi:dipeptidyl aminopeptidase/acylaminoacyl peptidase